MSLPQRDRQDISVLNTETPNTTSASEVWTTKPHHRHHVRESGSGGEGRRRVGRQGRAPHGVYSKDGRRGVKERKKQ